MAKKRKYNTKGRSLESKEARAMSAARETFAGGRPRKKGVPRCPCGEMTLKRALARKHICSGPSPTATKKPSTKRK